MRKLNHSYGTAIYLFDSIKEVLETCDRRQYKQLDEDTLGMRLPTWDAVASAIDRPWQQGLEAVDKFVRELEGKELPELSYVRRQPGYSEDDGDEIDLDRLRAGQPYWRISKRQSVIGPTEVTIVTDLSADKFVSATDILWRGAAAIAMTKILEDRGYSVTLWVTRTSCPYASEVLDGEHDQYARVLIGVCLKQAGDRLDLSTLVNAVSGWFYRSVLMTLTRTLAAKEGKTLAKGLGTPERPYLGELDAFTSPVNRLYSLSEHSYGGALAAMEYGLEKVRESQLPPVPVEDDDGEVMPTAQGNGQQQKQEDVKPPKKVKMAKVRKVKVPKRATEL